ncbi:AAA domain protein [Reticulomyxa filosa]|uniref:AAA domain protein n=1 Tax=Reticulomyxa filosa TaxID=46433 RepID=X6MR64_RETFI|nr:AAA domain protein [Reticulomyxa filosa]|eukprot:ETO15595.1 AAA domain protein [Reticulomyxa filosa]
MARTPPPTSSMSTLRKSKHADTLHVSTVSSVAKHEMSPLLSNDELSTITPTANTTVSTSNAISVAIDNGNVLEQDQSSEETQGDKAMGEITPSHPDDEGQVLSRSISSEALQVDRSWIKQQMVAMKQKAMAHTPKDDMESDMLAVLQQLDGYALMKEAEMAERSGDIGNAMTLYQEAVNAMSESLKHADVNAHVKKQVREQISSYERKAQILRRRHVTDQAKLEGRRQAINRQRYKEQKKSSTDSRVSNAPGAAAATSEKTTPPPFTKNQRHKSVLLADRSHIVRQKNSERSKSMSKSPIVGSASEMNILSPIADEEEQPKPKRLHWEHTTNYVCVLYFSHNKETEHKRTNSTLHVKKPSAIQTPSTQVPPILFRRESVKRTPVGTPSQNTKEAEDEKVNDEKENDKKKGLLAKQDEEFRGRIEAEIIDEVPDVSFKDVQGLTGVKLVLYESVVLPQLRPEIFTGLRSPTTGLLLFGPPGNGKTLIAKCVARECNATFFSISASSITSKFVGDAERIMRTLFSIAREKAPSIIFIDEIDSLLTARGGQNEAESSRRIKTEFLVQFDGVHKASEAEARMLVIGATNLPHQLDDAVLRRFSKRIMVPLPDENTRYALLQNLMKKQNCEMTPWDMKEIVKNTNGYSFSDLTLLCKDAAMGPVRELGAEIMHTSQEDIPPISKKHFIKSLENIRPSVPEKSIAQYVEWNEKYGSQVRLHASALPESMRPETIDMPQTPEADQEQNDDKRESTKDGNV